MATEAPTRPRTPERRTPNPPPNSGEALPVATAGTGALAGEGVRRPDVARSTLDLITANTKVVVGEKGRLQIEIDTRTHVDMLMRSDNPLEKARGYDFRTLELANRRAELQRGVQAYRNHPKELGEYEAALKKVDAEMNALGEARKKVTMRENGEDKVVPDQTASMVEFAKKMGVGAKAAQENPLGAIEAAASEALKGNVGQRNEFFKLMGDMVGSDLSEDDREELVGQIQEIASDAISKKHKKDVRKILTRSGLGLLGLPLLLAWIASKMQGGGGGQGGH